MGRIAAPYGVRGWVHVQPFTEVSDSLLDHPQWRVGRGAAQVLRPVAEAKPHGDGLVARFEGIEDRDAALALRGQEVSVERAALPEIGDGEFYWSDLIGLTVVNREGVELGRIASLMETGAHDVLVVKGQREHLIPFVAQFVGEVDLASGKLEVDWGEDY